MLVLACVSIPLQVGEVTGSQSKQVGEATAALQAWWREAAIQGGEGALSQEETTLTIKHSSTQC